MWCGRRRSVALLLGCWRSCWRSCCLPWGVRAAGGGALRALSRAPVCLCHGARGRARCRPLAASGGALARLWSVCRTALRSRPCRRLVGSGEGWRLAAAGVGRLVALSRSGRSIRLLLTYLLTYLLLERGRLLPSLCSAAAPLSAAAAVGCCRLSVGRARSTDPRGGGGWAPRGWWWLLGCCRARCPGRGGFARGDEVRSLLIDWCG